MKKLCFIFILFFAAAIGVKAQECPADKVCISPEAARKAVENGETVKAQAVQIDALKQAVLDEKGNTHKVELQFAEVSGELTAFKQEAVRRDAWLDMALKNTHPKNICLLKIF